MLKKSIKIGKLAFLPGKLKRMRLGKNTLVFLMEALVAMAMFYLFSFIFQPQGPMSMFPAAILLIMIGVSVLLYVARIHMGGYTIKKAIEENNISYALMFLSIAIIIAAILSKI